MKDNDWIIEKDTKVIFFIRDFEYTPTMDIKTNELAYCNGTIGKVREVIYDDDNDPHYNLIFGTGILGVSILIDEVSIEHLFEPLDDYALDDLRSMVDDKLSREEIQQLFIMWLKVNNGKSLIELIRQF